MKVISFVTALLTSSIALAYPAVNDYAKYTGTITLADGRSMPITSEIELTAYDAATQKYTAKSTTTFAGQSQSGEQLLTEDDLIGRSAVQQIMGACQDIGGRSGHMTVPAGMFDVCVLMMDDGTSQSAVALGDVPFGTVRSQTIDANGTNLSLSLETIRWGK